MGGQLKHFVAVVGGAISGSVAAEILADHGVRVAVIEQNARPYGKIEDGLPRWHVEQRRQEYAHIDARLKKRGVEYVPCTRLGRDIPFEEFTRAWGFSAVILANGAWRDRDLGVPGAEKYVDKGLVYQNPFIYWYNHKNERDYTGARYDTPDEALVVGGGLASIDVVKILQIENYERALQARGLNVDMHELEKGIPAACRAHGVDPASLGVKGCLLIYRRREQDMPLAHVPDHATPDQMAKTEVIRQKMLRLAKEKYLFRVRERSVATGLIVEGERVVGLRVADTQLEGRRCDAIAGSEHELRAPLVISSIGSVPEVLPGVTMRGEYYTFGSEDLPRYSGAEHVFGVGNVVTGQGNIHVSLVHSQKVTKHLVENYLRADDEDPGLDARPSFAPAEARAAGQARAVEQTLRGLPALSDAAMAAVERRIRERQKQVGYTGDYDSWIAKVTPPDLE
jgi:NADPH-dependent glutamate synthase beta subunit-like oxidoreductase